MEWYWIVLIVLGGLVFWVAISALLYKQCFKRFYDIVFSGFALLVFGIPMLIVAIMVRVDLGKPVLFSQIRIGKNEKKFKLLKFRSMKNGFDEFGVPLPDSQRITKFGKFLRKTSIDELPSLINIFLGNMSIIGPRPLPWNYKPWFTKEERKRHSIRGGLTGLAQINGRNNISWEKKFEYDNYYVDHISLFLDVKILLLTVLKVTGQENIGERGNNATHGDFHCSRSGLSERELLELEKEDKLPLSYEDWINKG